MIPNKKNACGGAFTDWLEVNLIDRCNAACSWCVEQYGYHPTTHIGCEELSTIIVSSEYKNIILLGGEPTLYKDIGNLIVALNEAGKNVYITTNGRKLTPDFVNENLNGLTGVNISLHHYDMNKNQNITRLVIKIKDIIESIKMLHRFGTTVRLNCNCIKKYIDSRKEIMNYIKFAQSIGADKIRFAELKNDFEGFVNLGKILNYEYGLNDNPFICGCNNDVVIDGMPVNFRQMCGLQTPLRITPIDPQQIKHKVLYYDGKFYDGWQLNKKESKMDSKKLKKILELVAKGELTPEEALNIIEPELDEHESGGGCVY